MSWAFRLHQLFTAHDSLSFIRSIVLSGFFWALLLVPAAGLSFKFSFSYRSLATPARGEWLSRVISNIHALILLPLLNHALFNDNSLELSDGEFWSHRMITRIVLKITLGYFLYDFLLVLVLYRTISAPIATMIHHALIILTIYCVFVFDFPLVYIWAAGLLFTEMSTPFVNQRWFMAIRHRHSTMYKVNGLLMTLAFFIARPLFMPAFVLWIARKEYLYTGIDKGRMNLTWIIGGGSSLVLYLLNCYWFGLMMKGLKKALKSNDWASVEENGEIRIENETNVHSNGTNAVMSSRQRNRVLRPSPSQAAHIPKSSAAFPLVSESRRRPVVSQIS